MSSPAHVASISVSPCRAASAAVKPVKRIRSEDLFDCTRELEIEHEGRIYRLRMTR